MKIYVKSTYDESITGSGRCSDGSYRTSRITCSVKVYSDTEMIKVTTSEKITNFIEIHTETENDRVWDSSFKGASTETYDINLTKDLSFLLDSENATVCEIIDDCPYFLNPIAIKTLKSHKLAITELKNKHAIIHESYLKELEVCKALIAKASLYSSESAYDLNQLMPDFNMYPLDVARVSDDSDFLEFLLSKGATKVVDSYRFAEWLCKIGKFEYLIDFVDLTKLQLIRVGSSIDYGQQKNYRLTQSILYYSIVNNRLDIFKEYGSGRFNKDISEVNFSKTNQNYYSLNYISVGLIAVKHSTLETIKELYGKCTFFENIKSNYGSTKTILSEHCFRDYDTAYFFLDKLPVDSIYAMFYWNKIELLQSFIISEKFNLGNIYLSAFSEFFVQENNFIIEQLANINSFSLIKILNKNHNDFIPSCWRDNMVLMNESVLEKCASCKNFVLLRKIFSICIEKEKILSFDACRLLYTLYKYDENEEAEDLKQLIVKFIDPDDLMKLLGVACMKINLRLLKFLITQVDNINAPIDMELTLFGLVNYKGFVDSIVNNYKNGTLLHLALVANPNLPGRWLNIELIKILLNADVDKSIKDESGKLAFDYIKNCYNNRDDSLQKKELVEMLYIEDVKVCSKKGKLIELFKGTELPIINKFESYLSSGINAVIAYKKDNIEALNFFLSCGAEIESLKEEFEFEKRRIEITEDYTNYDYDDSYTEQELRDMYIDAFDGNPDAEWNID